MSTVLTIPQTTIPVGPRTFGPANVANGISLYLLTLQQVGWPHAGDLAFTYSCDYSLDGGNTWITSSSGDILDAPIPTRNGRPAGQITITCDIPGTGVRKIRFVSNWAKALTISGSLAAN